MNTQYMYFLKLHNRKQAKMALGFENITYRMA